MYSYSIFIYLQAMKFAIITEIIFRRSLKKYISPKGFSARAVENVMTQCRSVNFKVTIHQIQR